MGHSLLEQLLVSMQVGTEEERRKTVDRAPLAHGAVRPRTIATAGCSRHTRESNKDKAVEATAVMAEQRRPCPALLRKFQRSCIYKLEKLRLCLRVSGTVCRLRPPHAVLGCNVGGAGAAFASSSARGAALFGHRRV